jgi:peptide/nickel transport system substrate-binding protein
VRHGFGSRKRGGAAAVALALVLAISFSACGSSGSSKSDNKGAPTTGGLTGQKPDDAGKPTMGGSVKFSLEADTNGGWCLPLAQLAQAGIQVARSIYDYLVVPNEKGEYVPSLADSVKSNADYTSWTIHLRSGIKFHDGTDFNAAVVKQNIDAYRKGVLFSFVFPNIKDTAVVDPMTVRVDMVKPWSNFPASLYSYGRMGMAAAAQLNNTETCWKNMIGTGPFMFKGDWVKNEHLTVVRNPNYWRKDQYGQRLPYLDKITFYPVVQTATLVNGFQANPPQFDIGVTSDTNAIDQLHKVVDAGNLDMLESGQNPEVAYTLFNVSKPPFDNILARKAFATAIDRDKYNELANKDLLELASGPFGPGTLGYLPDTGLPKYSPEQAKTYVQQYTKETGQPLAFTYQTGQDSIAKSDAEIIGKYVEAAGMKMNIVQVDQAKLIDNAIGGNFQASAWRNHPGFDPDTQWVWWHCDKAPAAVGTSKNVGDTSGGAQVGNNCDNLVNFTRFNDSVINKALETGRTSNDPDVRRKAYEDLNREFAKQLWAAWGYWTLWTIPSQKEVQGILGPNLPTATSPDATPEGDKPFGGLASGNDMSGLWIKKG